MLQIGPHAAIDGAPEFQGYLIFAFKAHPRVSIQMTKVVPCFFAMNIIGSGDFRQGEIE
jgi:hypothetical protein